MLKGTSVTAVVFYVRDLERTVAFYRDILGLEIRRLKASEADEEHDFVIADAGEVSLVFFEGNQVPGRTPIVVFGLNSGIEEIVDNLARQGVEIVLPVSDAPGGGLTADFLDPDGHVLSFYQNPRQQDTSAAEAS